jgi:hypothetical protein
MTFFVDLFQSRVTNSALASVSLVVRGSTLRRSVLSIVVDGTIQSLDTGLIAKEAW